MVFNNTAVHRGGGLHAISSSVESVSAYSDAQYTGAQLNFTRNRAELGGGISLEANAKIHIFKSDKISLRLSYSDDNNTMIFTANKADYGGGLYVDDATYSGICASSSKRHCFF